MNNIKLYINQYNKTLNDIKIEELQIITEQSFTFTEDAHDSIFFKNIATDLFYKDEKNLLLKQSFFSKQNFIENLNTIKFYFNQLTLNNSVILLGINDPTKEKYKLPQSNIAFIFKNIKTTNYFYLNYSIDDIEENLNITFDNNFTMFFNQEKNEYLSKYNDNSYLEYNSDDYEKYFKTTHEEISNTEDNYLKVFFHKDTSFHIPKVYASLYFFHPFYRPNFVDQSNKNNIYNNYKNQKLFFEYLLYFAYMKRAIQEKLSDVFRAGGQLSRIEFNEIFFSIDLFIFSDKVKDILNIINNIIYNQTNFKSELEKRFEIYRDMVLDDFLEPCFYYVSLEIEYTFYEIITEDKKNNLPPIYNYCNFPKESFSNINLDDLDIEEILMDIHSIKYIYLFGYFNETDAKEIYELFKTTNYFYLPLENANFNGTKINDSNYVEWVFEKPLIKNTSIVTINSYKDETNRFMNFIEYNLKSSCLFELFVDIISKDKHFINQDISIVPIKQKYIYIGYTFKNEVIENKEFMTNLIDWLKDNEDMERKKDIIGDKFYYLFQGYKKAERKIHLNMIEAAWQIAYDHLFKTFRDFDSILEFNIEDYKSFIKEIEKLVYPSIPFVEIKFKE